MTADDKLSAQLEVRASGAPQQQGMTIADKLRNQQEEYARALPRGMDADRFARMVLTECRRTPQLLRCTHASLLGATMTAAQLGLEPGPIGHCYLVPRRKAGSWEVAFQLGYKGIIDLAMRGGRVLSLRAHVVYAADQFSYEYGTNEHLSHVPALDAEDLGVRVCVYAVAKLAHGGAQFVVLSMNEVERRRARGSADSPAWQNDYDAMAAKTGVRALGSFLPQTPEFALAQRLDDTVRTSYTVTLDELTDDDEQEVTAGDPATAAGGTGSPAVADGDEEPKP